MATDFGGMTPREASAQKFSVSAPLARPVFRWGNNTSRDGAQRRGAGKIDLTGGASEGGIMAYQVEFSSASERQLGQLTARDRNIMLKTVGLQLAHEPTVPTRHRKLM